MRAGGLSSPGLMHSDREDKNDSHIFNFSVYTTFLSLPVLP